MKGRCEARVSVRNGGQRCSFAAKHTHETGDIKLHLCTAHFRVLTHRGHLGTEVDLVKRWTT